MVEWPLATPTIAFWKSPSPKPTARSIARFGERAAPWVMVLLLQLSDMESAPDFSVAFCVILTERPSRTFRTVPGKRVRGAAKAAPLQVTGIPAPVIQDEAAGFRPSRFHCANTRRRDPKPRCRRCHARFPARRYRRRGSP